MYTLFHAQLTVEIDVKVTDLMELLSLCESNLLHTTHSGKLL